MRKAAFFDRDGTINVNFGHVYKPEDLVFVQGTPEIIADYNRQGVPVIVVTNQAGIAKGLYTEEDMHRFHAYMNERLEKEYGAHIDAFYFCPHHPDFTGPCDCRKPKPGMFLQAAKDWDIDLSRSVMYGDKDGDREAAKLAGIPIFCFVDDDKVQ
jgi:D,D-heptose 1,7-bisphosphate phosphatase